MPTVTYPFGPLGTESSNLISKEIHTVSEVNDATQRIIIPKFAPFHLNNLAVFHRQDDGVVKPLVEGVDYGPALEYLAASRSLGKPIYGGVQLKNLLTNGELQVTYQTVGDKWCADDAFVLERLATKVYNPRTTVWDVLTNVQQLFPPIAHDQSYDYVFGQKEVVDALRSIETALLRDNSPTVMEIVLKVVNALTKESVGLGNLQNLEIATDEDVRLRRAVPKLVRLDHLIKYGIAGGGGSVNGAELYYLSQSKG